MTKELEKWDLYKHQVVFFLSVCLHLHLCLCLLLLYKNTLGRRVASRGCGGSDFPAILSSQSPYREELNFDP